MIKPISFTHDIDRSYLQNEKKKRRSIKRTRTQNSYDIQKSNQNLKEDQPDLIRKKLNSSDEEFKIKVQKVVIDVTDKDGLIKIAEILEKRRKLKKVKITKSKDQLKIQSNSKDNFNRFKPIPPKILPGMKRRPLPGRSKNTKVEKETEKEPKSFQRFRPRPPGFPKERVSNSGIE